MLRFMVVNCTIIEAALHGKEDQVLFQGEAIPTVSGLSESSLANVTSYFSTLVQDNVV